MSRHIIQRGDFYIELLEECPCLNNMELRMKEQKWYDLIPNINHFRPYVSVDDAKAYSDEYQKAYRTNNADKIKERRTNNADKAKAYRINNADKIKAYQKEYRTNNADKAKAYQIAYYTNQKQKQIQNQ
jgi:hypothetical protein